MRLVFTCLACSFAIGVAAADPSPAPTAPIAVLSLPDAIHLALAHNPDSLTTDEDVRAARGAYVQSHALPNPALFVYALGKNLSPIDAPVPNQFGVTWTIPIGGKRGAGIAAAGAALDAAGATRIAARRQLELEVSIAFISVLLDQAQLDFAKQDQAGLHQAVDLDEIRYKDGKIAYSDVLKLRIQERGTDDTVRQDELTLATDRAELARLVGDGTLAPEFSLAGTLAPPAFPTLTTEALLERALAERPDYKALLASERSAQSSLTQARRQPIPDLGVLLDYDRVAGTAGAFDVELSATIPLFDRNAGNTLAADAAARKAHLAIESLKNQLRADVTKAVRALETSAARLKVYDQQLLSEAKESLDITRHAYEQGRGTLLDYLDAESSYRDVEREYRSAVGQAMLAATQVRFVAGEELP
jgi:outer membrane protein, heavy metal efflux system